MQDERSLVEQVSRGDVDAVHELMEQHREALLAYVRRNGGDLPAHKESAADLVQSVCREVLEQLADARFEYRGEAEFRAWLYEATQFKIANRRRFWRAQRRDVGRERRVEVVSDDSRSRAVPELSHDGPRPSQHAIEREQAGAAAELLAQLPERHREVIELVKLQGLTHAQAAERLGITVEASRMLLSRALARLATLAGKSGDAD